VRHYDIYDYRPATGNRSQRRARRGTDPEIHGLRTSRAACDRPDEDRRPVENQLEVQ
jgi:hypothetical protein